MDKYEDFVCRSQIVVWFEVSECCLVSVRLPASIKLLSQTRGATISS